MKRYLFSFYLLIFCVCLHAGPPTEKVYGKAVTDGDVERLHNLLNLSKGQNGLLKVGLWHKNIPTVEGLDQKVEMPSIASISYQFKTIDLNSNKRSKTIFKSMTFSEKPQRGRSVLIRKKYVFGKECEISRGDRNVFFSPRTIASMPNGNMYLVSMTYKDKPGTYLVDVKQGKVQCLFEEQVDLMIVDPKGKRVYCEILKQHKKFFYDFESNKIVSLSRLLPNHMFMLPKWSPDGLKLAYIDYQNKSDHGIATLQSYHVKDAKTNVIAEWRLERKQKIYYWKWTPDSQHILVLEEKRSYMDKSSHTIWLKLAHLKQKVIREIYSESTNLETIKKLIEKNDSFKKQVSLEHRCPLFTSNGKWLYLLRSTQQHHKLKGAAVQEQILVFSMKDVYQLGDENKLSQLKHKSNLPSGKSYTLATTAPSALYPIALKSIEDTYEAGDVDLPFKDIILATETKPNGLVTASNGELMFNNYDSFLCFVSPLNGKVTPLHGLTVRAAP